MSETEDPDQPMCPKEAIAEALATIFYTLEHLTNGKVKSVQIFTMSEAEDGLQFAMSIDSECEKCEGPVPTDKDKIN